MDVLALALADARFPGGGHVHSGGLEEAAGRGLITGESDLPAFLLGRLHTAGALAAVFAGAAAHAARRGAQATFWGRLDAELDARTPSAAQREASRAQGAGTLRALRATPARLPALRRPHHCVVLGVAIGLGGGLPVDAARTAAYLSVSGPAAAAVRLLGLDPLAVNATVLDLAGELRAVAEWAAATAALDPAELPAPGAPGLDLLAESHRRAHDREVRLFAS
ncbi:MAG TPA: urease accessory UreF family protein [Actinophytocola sp.]|uniref:urease accessory protein UreF n=1 Tax=Actinophytocola sp. TaxID=1872138 RepID=UPI002DBB12FD|nr:urease accessory UreF family protein [Actinophytocola sp.]HEU5475439.1 urease accessory UreF family protein [Actinophytocola sp.]